MESLKHATRRLSLGALGVLLLASCMSTLNPALQPTQAAPSGTGQTTVAIQGTRFLVNGELTSPGKPAQGMLLNTRMAQGIFDDENSATAAEWRYPDTHTWDAQRNTNELVAMLASYAQHGIRMITVGLQGGCPSTSPPCPGGDHAWIVSAFKADGSLKPAWMNRLKQVITAADHNGIVVMVQFFYHGQNQRVNDPDTTTAQRAAVNNITDWLVNSGYGNVLVETVNECDAGFSDYLDGGNCANEANVVKQVQERSGGKLKVGVSWKGGEQPSDAVITQEDFVLLHGNGIDGTQLQALIASTRQSAAYKANPTPIVVNEDSTSVANRDAAVAAGVLSARTSSTTSLTTFASTSSCSMTSRGASRKTSIQAPASSRVRSSTTSCSTGCSIASASTTSITWPPTRRRASATSSSASTTPTTCSAAST